MINMVASTELDLGRIESWTRADAWHKHQDKPNWWLTGNGYLAFRVEDEVGPLVYTRVDREDAWYRVHCQFAPRHEASRERIITALEVGFQRLLLMLPTSGTQGLRFDSENPSLIRFLKFYGFERDDSKGDYVYRFEGIN